VLNSFPDDLEIDPEVFVNYHVSLYSAYTASFRIRSRNCRFKAAGVTRSTRLACQTRRECRCRFRAGLLLVQLNQKEQWILPQIAEAHADAFSKYPIRFLAASLLSSLKLIECMHDSMNWHHTEKESK